MGIRSKLKKIFQYKGQSIRSISSSTGIPKSTVHYHVQKRRLKGPTANEELSEQEKEYAFWVRVIVSSIYIFGVKGGKGAGSLSEFFQLCGADQQVGLSESAVLKIIKRVEALILEYKSASESNIHSKVDEIKLILGVDETWFDQMYLVCQELSSGYIFFEETSDDRKAASWDSYIKKSLYTTT